MIGIRWIATAGLLAACTSRGAAPRAAEPPPGPVVERHPPVATIPIAPAPKGRLGDQAVPQEYHLEIELDPRQRRFRGRVIIELEVRAPLRSVWLHGVDLEVTSAQLESSGRQQEGTALPVPEGRELLGFSFPHDVPAGHARLTLRYSGKLGGQVGAFRQRHGNQWYAFTDFEPTDARRAFPAFDDPRFKARWNVSLVIPEGMSGFSNGPLVRSTPLAGGKKKLTFARTRPLPTYLVAFAAGPFEVVEGPKDPVPLRIITLAGTSSHAAHAIKHGPRYLELVQSYFGTPVPFPKIDLIAVPRFNGAMENPGLITVAARILLVDPKRRSPLLEKLHAIVATHEFAHLWFGDLVTMEHWNDLWLNEGFATWMSDKMVARAHPGFETRIEEIALRNQVMSLDAELDTRAVRQPIRSPTDIRAAFDAITYRKGGALLQMFETWLGPEVFQQGVRRYLARHRDGNATAADLMKALARASGKQVAPLFRSFLDQSGLPLVAVDVRCGSRNAVTLRQSRYLPLHGAARASAADRARRWKVPVCISADGQKHCAVVGDAEASIELPSCPRWVHPNADGGGYYRYALEPKQLDALRRASLSPRELTDLVGNVEALLRSGQLGIGRAMPIIAAGAGSSSRHAIEASIELLELLSRTVIGPRQRRAFAARVRRLLGKNIGALGATGRPGEPDRDALLRPALVQALGLLGDQGSLLRGARPRALRWLGGEDAAIEPGLIGATLSLAAAAGDESLFEAMAKALTGRESFFRRWMVAGAMLFRRPALIRRSVDLATGPGIHFALAHRLLSALLASPRTRDLAWKRLQQRKSELRARTPRRRRAALATLVTGLCGDTHAAEARRFLSDLVPRGSSSLDDAVGEIEKCARFAKHHRAEAAKVFR